MITFNFKSLMKKNLHQLRHDAHSFWKRTSVGQRVVFSLLAMMLAFGCAVFSSHYRLAVNVTESLPGHLYLIKRDAASSYDRSTLIAFRWMGDRPIPQGTTVVKEIAGVAGDTISHREHEVFINGQTISRLKSHSKAGTPLVPGPTGVISENHYYVHAPHPDSLDSRYAKCGLIHASQIIGEAIELF